MDSSAAAAPTGEVLCVNTFNVDASPGKLVALLSPTSVEQVRAGWLTLVPSFEEGCDVVQLPESAGFRATNKHGSWMWVTDIACVQGQAPTVFSCRVYVSEPEEPAGARPSKHMFTVVQTWTLALREGGATVERKFTDFVGSEGTREFLLGGMIAKENENVVTALAE